MRSERELRDTLGIPQGAPRVLILAESSHWDPNWLFTSEEYFTRWVRPNLDAALEELGRDARRVYSIECLFFLIRYWDERPEKQESITTLVNDRRLRLTSSAVTTADTLTASAETVLRDFLVGQEWLRARGMTEEPTLAYFPDSFGCSHALPSLLNAAGFDRTALTRLDGMHFTGCDWPLPSLFEREGSSAALLKKKERTLDFIWRDSDGGEVLCHWNAFTYGQGDMLASRGISRVYLFPLALPARSERHVSRRIEGFVRRLQPYSRTPYMFCPIGFDFVAPIPDLLSLLDRYNLHRYPRTGIWVVNAGLDDYLNLVDCHRDRLPIVALDPNPYWTGFYSSRPTLKRLSHQSVDRLSLAEGLEVLTENRTEENAIRSAWSAAVVQNHHDNITGTATDRVAETEQIPWIERTIVKADAAIASLQRGAPSIKGAGRPRAKNAGPPEWKMRDGVVEALTRFYRIELSEEAGGCIVGVWDADSGLPLLHGPSNDLVSYEDSGGLWRMGHEFIGGRFRERGRSSLRPAGLSVHPEERYIDIEYETLLDGMKLTQTLRLRSDSPLIRCRTRGRAAGRRTVTVAFQTGIDTGVMTMDGAGGVIERPVRKGYDPTFWPAQSFFHINADGRGRGVAIVTHMPGAAAYRRGGSLELITHRNAVRETAFGFIHFPGLPVSGHERSDLGAEYGLLFTRAGDWKQNDLIGMALRGRSESFDNAAARAWIDELSASMLTTDPPGIAVMAIKHAWRGEGIIVRLFSPESRGMRINVTCLAEKVVAAWLCDARERDIEELEVRAGTVRFTMPGSIASVRMHIG